MEISQEPLEQYAQRCFHQSRIDVGLESTDLPEDVIIDGNKIPFNEDCVNVYLIGIVVRYGLRGFNDPNFCKYDDDLAKKVEEAGDNRAKKFLAYKVTADNLLLLGGLFDPLKLKINDTFRAGAYYHSAAMYKRELDRGNSIPALTLKRISNRLEDYIEILRHMATHYFNIHYEVGIVSLNRFVSEQIVKEKTDEFLDLYNEWRNSEKKDKDLKSKINMLMSEIKLHKPDFNPNLELN